MKTRFGKLKRYALLRVALYLIFGLLVFIFPSVVANIMVYLLAAYFIGMGILSMVHFFRANKNASLFQWEFISGVFFCLCGLICLIFSRQIISLIPLAMGFLIIIGSAIYLAQAISFQKSSDHSATPMFAYCVALIILGLVIIVNPFHSAMVLFRLFGIVLIAMAIYELIIYFRIGV